MTGRYGSSRMPRCVAAQQNMAAQIISRGFVRSVSRELIDIPTAYAIYPAVIASPIASFAMPRSGSRSTMQALRSVRQIWQKKYKMPDKMTSFQCFFFNALILLLISFKIVAQAFLEKQ